jgi:hypothetical protein
VGVKNGTIKVQREAANGTIFGVARKLRPTNLIRSSRSMDEAETRRKSIRHPSIFELFATSGGGTANSHE